VAAIHRLAFHTHRPPSLSFFGVFSQGTVKEAATKLGDWWKEVGEMQTEVKKFQAEANDKAVDELVHLQRVKDLLIELKKQVPMEEPPKPWSYTGETGPAHWATLDPTFATCGKF
jgi:hypothetical protein